MKQLIIQINIFIISGLLNTLFSQQLPVLDLAAALEQPSKILLGDFVESITYLPLATSSKCLVDDNPRVLVTKDYIITKTLNQCLLFNRKDGAFLREIGKYGRGPGEYRNTLGFFNESELTFYFMGWNGNLLKYSLDGAFKGSIKIPGYVDNLKAPSFPDVYTYLDNNTLVCNFAIFFGTEDKSIMIFDLKGNILKTLPNQYILKKKQNLVIRNKEIIFHHFNDNLFFQSCYNDTVFKLTLSSIEPAFILKRGKYLPPFESRWWPMSKQQEAGFISQPECFEDTRFISFNFYLNYKTRHFALYDKSQKSMRVTENRTGIENNIDGFMDFIFQNINDSGEPACMIQPVDLIKWIKDNPDKFKALRPDLQKFKDVKIGDNPIIVIGKYKK